MISYIRNELSNINIKNLWKDKMFLGSVIVGIVLVYIMFNIVTSTIKYPIIILGGLIMGKIIYDSKRLEKN